MDEPTRQAVTFAVAVLGAVLGVLNAWRAWSSDRLRIRVGVGRASRPGAHGPMISVEVVNLSAFAVTVTHLGFDLAPGGQHPHVMVPRPTFIGGECLPVRLDARTCVTAMQPLAAFQRDQLTRLRNAYVLTACGRKIKSPRGVFAQVRKAAAASAGDGAE